MSMIGLLAGAPQAATAKSAGGDATAAEGFGSTLQGALDALDALAETATVAVPADVLAPLVDSPTGGVTLPSTLPLVELVETSPPVSMRPQGDLLTPPEGSSTGSLPPVELVETPTAKSIPAPTSSAMGTPEPPATPLAPLVGAPAGSPLPASPVSKSDAGLKPSAAMLVENHGAELSKEGGVSLSKPEPGQAQQVTSLPTARPTDADASFGTGGVAPGSPRTTSSTSFGPVPENALLGAATAASASTLREAPVSTTPTVSATNTRAEAAPAPTAVAAPAAAPITAPPPVAPAAAVVAPAATASVPFATQLARPIFSLAAAGTGEHVMTVSVTPDNLGPVTVRAHVGADGVRVELFAPNELGRDAIRAIIPELRRDLAGAGLGGNLSLSSQNQPSADGSAHGSNAGQPGERDGRPAAGRIPASVDSGLTPTEQQVDRSGLFGTTSTIDVLA